MTQRGAKNTPHYFIYLLSSRRVNYMTQGRNLHLPHVRLAWWGERREMTPMRKNNRTIIHITPYYANNPTSQSTSLPTTRPGWYSTSLSTTRPLPHRSSNHFLQRDQVKTVHHFLQWAHSYIAVHIASYNATSSSQSITFYNVTTPTSRYT